MAFLLYNLCIVLTAGTMVKMWKILRNIAICFVLNSTEFYLHCTYNAYSVDMIVFRDAKFDNLGVGFFSCLGISVIVWPVLFSSFSTWYFVRYLLLYSYTLPFKETYFIHAYSRIIYVCICHSSWMTFKYVDHSCTANLPICVLGFKIFHNFKKLFLHWPKFCFMIYDLLQQHVPVLVNHYFL